MTAQNDRLSTAGARFDAGVREAVPMPIDEIPTPRRGWGPIR